MGRPAAVLARIRAIAKLKDRLLARADEIAATVAEETGKPIEEALLAEVIPNADLVAYWTGAAHALLDPGGAVPRRVSRTRARRGSCTASRAASSR